VLDLAWSPGDRWLATCSVDNTVVVWDVSGGGAPASIAVLRGHSGHVKGVTWDPVGKYLATQSADKSLRSVMSPHLHFSGSHKMNHDFYSSR
jgi:protein HIRA/HIR1